VWNSYQGCQLHPARDRHPSRRMAEGNLLADSVWGGTQGEAVHGLWIDGEYVYLTVETRTIGEGMNDALLMRAYIPTASFPPLPDNADR